MKKRASGVNRRVFKPRLLPRDKYDWRWMAVAYPLGFMVVFPLALLWFFLPMVLTMKFVGDPLAVTLVMSLQWLLWMGFFLTPMVERLEMDEEGLYVVGPLRSHKIDWDDIESVKVVTRGEVLKASLRWPLKDPSLRFSNSPFTFSQYIRIRHKSGTLYYSAKETEELLTALLARRQMPETLSRWYTVPATMATTEESPLRMRRG